MRALLAAILACVPAMGAIQGTVINKTTGKPQPGVTVVLTSLGAAGMQVAGKTVSGADGKFKIEGDASSAHLVQASWQGVNYNQTIQPGAANFEIAVYDALPKVSAAEVAQHMILLETDGKELIVNESVVFQNDSQTTWYDPKNGTLRVYVPPAAGDEVRARVLSPGGMPVERQPKRAAEKGVWYLDTAVKPGETRFDISYKMPATDPVTYSGRILHDPSSVRLVIPQGISLQGDGVAQMGTEPTTQATVWSVKDAAFKVTLTGTGALREAPASQQDSGGDGPGIQTIQPPGYERNWKIILALTLAILALGFVAQYLKGGAGSSRKA
jgi:5-hydroxyisourate hydrolase-like protein (transthyretin family)